MKILIDASTLKQVLDALISAERERFAMRLDNGWANKTEFVETEAITALREALATEQSEASVTKDAERYRWLRENSNKVNYCLLCGYDALYCWEADALDLQIDVAMEALAKVGTDNTGEGS